MVRGLALALVALALLPASALAHATLEATIPERGAKLDKPPAEVYCHTLTDPSILGADLRAAGFQTLTLFGVHAPARLFRVTCPTLQSRDSVWRRRIDWLMGGALTRHRRRCS